jgi:hypothetical protein
LNNLFWIDRETYLKIIELAKQHEKQTGESIQEEFDEIKNLYPEKFKFLGTTDMDKDLLLGNLREETKLKILDLTQHSEQKDDKTE